MCGINGFNFEDKNLIERMNLKIKHRGPDDSGFFVGGGFSVGNDRLAIIDLSNRARQPMLNDDKSLAIVYNGEIFNFKDIRGRLEILGYKFNSDSDTEVLLKSYEEWGHECLNELNGIFAFAILHINEGKIFFARDRAGVNPLYYYFDGKRIIFSSEIKAIFEHKDIQKEIDMDALNFYFKLLYIPSPKTIWKKIYKVQPGHYGVFTGIYAGRQNAWSSEADLKIKRYWGVSDFNDIEDQDLIKSEIKRLVNDSVKIQLVSDRPVGLFLSGGIDSTAVCGAMSKFSKKVETFSIGFAPLNGEPLPEAEKYNRDFKLARLTARHFGTNHHEFLISAGDVKKNIEKAIYHMDEPISNHIQTINMILASETSKHVAVVLGGDGGDEVWGGYSRYYYDQLITRFQRLPDFVRKILKPVFAAGVTMTSNEKNLDKFYLIPGVDRYLSFWGLKEGLLSSYINPKIFKKDVARDFFEKNFFGASQIAQAIKKDFTKYMMYVDLLTWLPDESLARSNKMAMAYSLEQRVPLLDHRIIELGMKVKTQHKISKKGRGKDIFVEALREYLPAHVINQSKWGWFSPAAKWLRADLKEFSEEVLSEGYCQATKEFFDFKQINKMLEDHISKKQYNLNALWSLITFQIWYKNSFMV